MVTRQERVGGRGYRDWVVASWKWRLSLPGRHPASGDRCLSARQKAPVWFLGRAINNHTKATVTCTVPSGRYLMLSTPAVDCSTVEAAPFRAHSDRGLVACAHRDWERYFQSTKVTVDGTPTDPIGYDVRTAAFAFTMPATDNYLRVRGHRSGRIAVEASALLLTPLATGPHTIVARGSFFDGPTTTITYQLTVAA